MTCNLYYISRCFNAYDQRRPCCKGETLEYHGFLMAGYYDQEAGTTYACVDNHPDTLRGGSTDEDGKLFYLLKAACESMKCPPYVGGTELVGVNLSKE